MTNRPSVLCNPQLSDPLTTALGFMTSPNSFRGCCHFTLGVWEQAVYLEGELPCAVGNVETLAGSVNVPISLVSFPRSSYHRLSALVLRNIPKLTILDDTFLAQGKFLKVVVFENLPDLVELGGMHSCTALETVTIRNLPMLQKLGHRFLSKCTCLKQAVFQDLPELTEVGYLCMSECASLETITLSKLPQLISIGAGWLQRCPALASASLGRGGYLPELNTVGNTSLEDYLEAPATLLPIAEDFLKFVRKGERNLRRHDEALLRAALLSPLLDDRTREDYVLTTGQVRKFQWHMSQLFSDRPHDDMSARMELVCLIRDFTSTARDYIRNRPVVGGFKDRHRHAASFAATTAGFLSYVRAEHEDIEVPRASSLPEWGTFCTMFASETDEEFAHGLIPIGFGPDGDQSCQVLQGLLQGPRATARRVCSKRR